MAKKTPPAPVIEPENIMGTEPELGDVAIIEDTEPLEPEPAPKPAKRTASPTVQMPDFSKLGESIQTSIQEGFKSIEKTLKPENPTPAPKPEPRKARILDELDPTQWV